MISTSQCIRSKIPQIKKKAIKSKSAISGVKLDLIPKKPRQTTKKQEAGVATATGIQDSGIACQADFDEEGETVYESYGKRNEMPYRRDTETINDYGDVDLNYF